ncbi:MAG: peptide synthase [Desulfobacteraceae bacterium 4572_35.1]|nr:MAG: peptide synthase [Desulfobacteraceae bacterium 4572_35.1]
MDNKSTPNIASYLSQRAKQIPYSAAVVYPDHRSKAGQVSYIHYTYAQLDQESDHLAATLHKNGVECGQRTVVMVKPGLDFFAITFALFKLGAIPVLIDPGMGIKNIKRCLEQAKPQVFIGISKAQLARKLLSWGKGSLQKIFTTASVCFPDCQSLPKLKQQSGSKLSFTTHQPSNDEIAAILFTSGSTGTPKGAIYTHANFNAQINALQRLYNIQVGEIDLCTFPLFALFAPALGMTAIIPDMDATKPAQVNPQRIFEAIENFGVTNMFGSPALLRRVANFGTTQQLKLPTLKRVISAGAPVPAAVLEQFSSMLNDKTPIYTPYGATEALPVCSIDSNTILNHTRYLTDSGQGICVGCPVDGADVRIISIDDNAIDIWDDNLCVDNGIIGEICVKGEQVTRGYFDLDAATELAKIPCFDGFYHRMGDLGYCDNDGKIWFCGRKTQRVQTTQETMFTIPCEAVFNTHPKVYRTALVGIGKPGNQQPILCVELLNKQDLKNSATIAKELRIIQEKYPHTKSIVEILFHPSFPVDIRHNAKIFREKLAVWAGKKLS